MIPTRCAFRFVAPFALAFCFFADGFAPAAMAASAEPEDAAYGALHEAMIASSDQEAVFENTMKAVEKAYREAPQTEALEQQSPGIIAKMVKAMRPAMRAVNQRIQRQYRPELIAVYKRHLTPSEARDLADFYNGPLGKRLARQASAGYSPDAALADLKPDSAITQRQIDADLNNAMSAAVQDMSEADRQKIIEAIARTPALRKLQPVFDETRVVRLRMENEQPTPQEEFLITSAINRVLRDNL